MKRIKKYDGTSSTITMATGYSKNGLAEMFKSDLKAIGISFLLLFSCEESVSDSLFLKRALTH